MARLHTHTHTYNGLPMYMSVFPTVCASGADKNIENDEPLFFSSSSDEEQDEDEPIRAQDDQRQDALQPVSCRKRPAGGHTPLDLAKCQKVTE